MALVQPRKVNPIPQAQPASGIPAPKQTPKWSAPEEAFVTETVAPGDNMWIWAQVQSTPDNACKDFTRAGGFSGTNINPVWRIKKLTEVFGPAGIGWYTIDHKFTIHPCPATGEAAVMCELYLVVRDPMTKEWSQPVFGVGGNLLFMLRKGQIVLNDEGYKMAYTDAIGVACKALGFSADIYWSADKTKYDLDTEAVKATAREKNVAQAESLKILSNYGQSSPLLPDDVTAVLKALSEEFGAILNGTPDEGMSALMEAQQALVDSGEIPENFSFGDVPVKELAGIITKIRSYIQAKVATNTNTVKSFFSAKKEG